jgi:hypothetical protein
MIACMRAFERKGNSGSVESMDFGRRFVTGWYKSFACSGGIKVHDLMPGLVLPEEYRIKMLTMNGTCRRRGVRG